MLSIYYRKNLLVLMTLYSKTLISKIGSCDFKGAIKVADN